ncbi:IS701 family transposase domain protein [Candidatus Bealeia paramacronuclearis]
MKSRWKIEVYHRELKQTCGLERCQSRTGRAQRNHIFLAISAWIQRFKRRLAGGFSFISSSGMLLSMISLEK